MYKRSAKNKKQNFSDGFSDNNVILVEICKFVNNISIIGKICEMSVYF